MLRKDLCKEKALVAPPVADLAPVADLEVLHKQEVKAKAVL